MTRENTWRLFRKWTLNIGLIGLGCVLAFTPLEVGLRLYWHPELTAWQRNLNVTIPLDPEVTTGVAGPAHIITNSQGIRGTEWSNDRSQEYRILAIGSSNTECLLQDQPNTWTALLQTRMPTTLDGRSVWVGNAGVAGHTSRHMVLAMRYMLDQYHPDAVIVFPSGDATLILNEIAAYDPGFIDKEAKMRDLAWDFAEQPVSLVDTGSLSIRNTFLGMFLLEFRDRFFSGSARKFVQNAASIRDMQEKWQQATLIVDEMPDIQAGLDGFHHNLLEMVRLAQAQHVHLVFMTQPSLLKPDMQQAELDRLWFGPIPGADPQAYWSPKVRLAVLDALNRVLMETCRDEGIDCIDLAS